MEKTIGAVVLAGGKGTRMHSEEPKVLRTLLGEPMLGYVLAALAPLFEDRVHVVVGHGADKVRAVCPAGAARFAIQEPQLGTGHALQCAFPDLEQAGYGYVLVLNGDAPLVDSRTLAAFSRQALERKADMAFMSIELPDPGAYGRVARDAQGRARIVEAKDYDESLHGPAGAEVNAGVYFFSLPALRGVLHKLKNENKSGEFYITDLAELVAETGGLVVALNQGRDDNLLGINSPTELVRAEELLRERIVNAHLARGVLVRAASGARIGPKAVIEPGAELSGPCDILGATTIASGAVLEPNVWVKDSTVGPGAVIHAFSHLDGAAVGPGCRVGPYGRLRPGAVLEDGARVGNFVEMKKAVLGPGAKANHLTYLGDAEIGAGSNIGAGTITCNYDGVNKHKTVIGQRAFIGSNTALVAPVTVGADALVGAGSVITKDVADGELAVARGRQMNIRRPKKPS